MYKMPKSYEKTTNQPLRSDDYFVVVDNIPWYDMRFSPIIQLEWVGGWMNSCYSRFDSK